MDQSTTYFYFSDERSVIYSYFNLTLLLGTNVAVSWNLMFGFVLWLIWLNKNEVVFRVEDGQMNHLFFLDGFYDEDGKKNFI